MYVCKKKNQKNKELNYIKSMYFISHYTFTRSVSANFQKAKQRVQRVENKS